ncbi:MAG TPA: PilZ domain-containing protein [Candidatus Methylomirabilis sp.]
MTPDITHADYPRFEAYLPVECAAPIPGRPSARLIAGRTRFVSAAGLEILMPETLPLRTPMMVRVAQGDPLRAHVVWADQGTPTPAGTRVAHGVLFERPVDPALVNQWVYRGERQAYARTPVRFPVEYGQAGTAGHGTCVNLSRGGMFVATPQPAPPGSQVALTFNLPNLSHTFSMLARVVWNHRDETKPDAPSGMGVQFLDPKPAEGALIDALVDRLCSEMSLALDSSPSTAPSH